MVKKIMFTLFSVTLGLGIITQSAGTEDLPKNDYKINVTNGTCHKILQVMIQCPESSSYNTGAKIKYKAKDERILFKTTTFVLPTGVYRLIVRRYNRLFKEYEPPSYDFFYGYTHSEIFSGTEGEKNVMITKNEFGKFIFLYLNKNKAS